MKKILELKNVTKTYKLYNSNLDRLKEIFVNKSYHKAFMANKNISFDLYEGETLGIIGVNGAGKSTILKIIAGVIEPTQGEIIRHGRVTALLELGTGFNDEMNGYENIYLNGTLIGMSREEIEKRREEIIAFSELGRYMDEPIRTYSSGMKMRLAFSIAIFSEPQILIVDEALSVGDAHFGAKCTKALKERQAKNMSIIYVSHDLNSLKILCDRVLLLNGGELIENGKPEDIINRYNFYIAKLNDEEKQILQEKQDDNFGTFDVEILKVTITGEQSTSNLITSGEKASIEIQIVSKIDASDMTLGILIRDKFGQDIFGTNTFHNGLKIDLQQGKEYICRFSFMLNIGVGKYSITAAIHSQDTHLEKCAHWLDHAVDFEVIATNKTPFIGLCRLDTTIALKEIEK